MFTTAVDMVNFYLGTAPDGRPAAGTLRRHLADDTFRAVHVKAGPDGSLVLAIGEGEDLPATALLAEDLDVRLREGLGL